MNGLKNLKVRTKIFFIIFISTFALFAVGATGFYHMHTMKENTTEMYNDRLLPIRWVNIARANLHIVKGNVLETMLTSDPSRQEELMKEIDEAMKENND
jgi:methyl-accepting chemotaxis protein